jgi:hypothetical protein
MLVMRNFGYLGLHSVVDKKSSLARDRLVDFTGELQVRAKTADETKADNEMINTIKRCTGEEDYKKSDDDAFMLTVPGWHAGYVAEATLYGGRNKVDEDSSPSRAHLYAQELAPLPLQLTPSARMSAQTPRAGFHRGRLQGDDIEPFYNVSFCNELLFHPRLLHNCPKGNITIKVELREIEWRQSLNGYVAHLPRSGPNLHNPRRGPFLVQSAFTGCSPRAGDHQFIDEFKLKLPLDLDPSNSNGSTGDGRIFALVFTVFNVRIGSKTSRGKARASQPKSTSVDSEFTDDSVSVRLDQVACGILTLSRNSCLLDNGLHDVLVIYNASHPLPDVCERESFETSALLLVEQGEATGSMLGSARAQSYADRGVVSASSIEDNPFADVESKYTADKAFVPDVKIEYESPRGRHTQSLDVEAISLSVRVVVHSALHAQSETLNAFLQQEPFLPHIYTLPDIPFISKLAMGRESVLTSASLKGVNREQPLEDKLIELTIDVSKHALCSAPQSSSHIWRIMPLLWRMHICGTGEPDVIWANPSSSTSLRVHSFASILHMVGLSSMFFTKSGLCKVEGTSGWNVVVLGRVLALLFDEKKLFGEQSLEAFDENMWLPKKHEQSQKTSAATSPTVVKKKRRHVRQTYDLSNDMPQRGQNRSIGSMSSLDFSRISGQLDLSNATGTTLSAPRIKSLKIERVRQVDVDPESWFGEPGTGKQKVHETKRDVKVDSKSDFLSALRATSLDDDADGLEGIVGDGGFAAKAAIQAFGGAQGNRRWATLPTRALSTIRESDDNESSTNGANQEQQTEATFYSELIPNRAPHSSVMQMRKPILLRDRSTESSLSTLFETSSDSGDFHKRVDSIGSVPKTDEEIVSAGTTFLEGISKSLGIQ